ncbi:hypothetical protein N9260_01355 [bacterium]|nr:hypothetical protein [bacterium]
MPAPYTVHDIRVKSPDPDRDQGILDASRNSIIETQVIPSRTTSKDRITNLIVDSRTKQNSFVNLQQGVKASKNHYKEEETRLAPFKKLVQFDSHTKRLDGSEYTDRESEMDQEVIDSTKDLFEDSTKQFYAGRTYDPKGFKGLPDFARLNFDALDVALNQRKIFAEGTDFVGATARFTTLWLVRIAQGTTNEALAHEKTGLRWAWQEPEGGAESAVNFGDRMSVSVPKNGGYNQEVHQFLEGFNAIQAKSSWDVVGIHNVPLFHLDEFILENVINTVWTRLRTGETAPNGIFMDRELLGPWVSARRDDTRPINVRSMDGPLGDSVMILDGFGPTIPLYQSELLPESLHKADLTNVKPIWKD